ncbi:MAG: 2,3,4,5-tetrahydropyridine-2,6-dicarboxylate N-succinyltransferase, partial [Putridiphycobacter sp.]|nr:2,3,4,5-tetrahydropyridine-2,6-dicarboxylate N-succinyltransferase [Putridiphycobacter sp.]
MKSIIEAAWNDRNLLQNEETRNAINNVIAAIDSGELRVAEPLGNGTWQVNEWVKKAVVMYFPIRQMETIEVGPFEFHDKMALKTGYKEKGIRVVPHAIARYG